METIGSKHDEKDSVGKKQGMGRGLGDGLLILLVTSRRDACGR